MRLSTPPRLSASFQIFVRATRSTASSSSPSEERDHPAEVPHLARGDRVAGVRRAGPGRGRARRAGGARGTAAIATAFAQCRSIRTASVFTPRRTSQRRTGPGTAPSDFCRNASCSASASSFVATKPPMTSEWPPRYFVVEWSATSAPSASGCWRYGRRERVVDDDERADRVRRLRRPRDVDDVERRVRRRLEPDELRPLVEVLGEPGRDLLRA